MKHGAREVGAAQVGTREVAAAEIGAREVAARTSPNGVTAVTTVASVDLQKVRRSMADSFSGCPRASLHREPAGRHVQRARSSGEIRPDSAGSQAGVRAVTRRLCEESEANP